MSEEFQQGAMSDVIRLARPPPSNDGFEVIYNRMADEIDSLRCVEAVMRANCVRLGRDLDAAMGLLIRTVKRIDELHTAFEEWHMRRRAGSRQP